METLNILKDASEIIRYDNINFPIYIKTAFISDFTNMEALCHWHDEIEFIYLINGSMNYSVNGKNITIIKNDGLLINSRQMHYGYAADKKNCEFLCVIFHPDVLCSTDEIRHKYVEPILDCKHLSMHYLHGGKQKDLHIIQFFIDMFGTFQKKELCYEIQLISRLNQFWLYWFKTQQHLLYHSRPSSDAEITIQKNMIQFIYDNYQKKLSLSAIAQAGGVCRSKCCQIFKKYLNKTPIEFLNAYRITISMHLLADSDLNMTEITYQCGFHNPSYFAEMFNKFKGCSPSSYRRLKKTEKI